MRQLSLILLLCGLAVCFKVETNDESTVKDLKVSKADIIDDEAKVEVSEPVEETRVATITASELRRLQKRSPGRRSREYYGYGYNYGGHSRGGRSRGPGGRSRGRGGRSRGSGGRSRGPGGRSRGRHGPGGRSRGGHSRYGGRSQGYYGNYGYGHGSYGHSGYGQSGYFGGRYGQGYIPVRRPGYPSYGNTRYIGVIRYGTGTSGSSGQQRPTGNCACPFGPGDEPSGSDYDFDYLRQWQRAFSSHPCCRQRWEVYWANSHRK